MENNKCGCGCEDIEIKMKSTHSRGAISCQHGIIGQKQSHLIEAICGKCDKVFKTDKNVYICPECQNRH